MVKVHISSVWCSYITALLLIAAMIFWSSLLFEESITQHENDTRIINLSGRQRMLTEKIRRLALELVVGKDAEDRAGLQQDLLNTVQRMKIAHRELSGNSVTQSPAVNSFFFGKPHALNDKVRAYLTAAHSVAAASPSDLAWDNIHFQAIRLNSRDLIYDLDDLVRQFQNESERRVSDTRFMVHISHATELLVLLIAGFFIFRPMENRTVRDHENLENFNNDLKAQVGERTRELERSEFLTRVIINATNNIMAFIDRDYIWRNVNQRFLDIHQKTRDEVIGHTVADVIGKDEFENHSKGFLDRCLAGESVNYKRWLKTQGFGELYLDADYIPFREEDGTVAGVVLCVRDVTERKMVEEELKLYKQMVSSSSDCMTYVDRDYTYQAVNQSYLDTFNRTRDEIVGHPVVDIVGTEFFERFSKPLYERVFAGEHVNDETWVERPGLGRRCFDVYFDPYRGSDGHVQGVVVSRRDITKRKVVEERLIAAKETAEAANLAKSRFLATISHELYTPLNHVVGYSELLREAARAQQRTQDAADLETVLNSAKHLQELIDNIFTLSQIEFGNMLLNPESFDVAQMVRDVASSMQGTMEQNDNRFIVGCDKDVGKMTTDVTRIRQCLLSLLHNSAKFTKRGQVNLSVSREWNNATEYFVFRVSDTGIGMSAEQVNKVFEIFTQVDASTTRKYGGAGLGLSVTHHLCRLMGGEINVDSELGKGSTFTIRIPVVMLSTGDVDNEERIINTYG